MKVQISFFVASTLLTVSSAMNISGMIIDSVSHDPLSHAKIALQSDTSQAVFTDANGVFHFLSPNTFILDRKRIGYRHSRNVGEDPENPILNICLFDIAGQQILSLKNQALIPSSISQRNAGIIFAQITTRKNRWIEQLILDQGRILGQSSVTTNTPFSQAKGTAKMSALRSMDSLKISHQGYADRTILVDPVNKVDIKAGLLPDTSASLNNQDTIIHDMAITNNESMPHGINADWGMHPRMGYGVTPPVGWSAFIFWGQIYEALEGNACSNYRINIRDARTYAFLKSDQKWHQLEYSKSMNGAAYVEDFVNDVNKPADIHDEADGSISVTVGGGFNFHFYTHKSVLLASDVATLFTTYQTRLIPNDFSKPDDRANCHVIASGGGDWWLNLTATWDQLKTNGDFAIGPFKYVRNQWRCHNAWAGDVNNLRNNPPVPLK